MLGHSYIFALTTRLYRGRHDRARTLTHPEHIYEPCQSPTLWNEIPGVKSSRERDADDDDDDRDATRRDNNARPIDRTSGGKTPSTREKTCFPRQFPPRENVTFRFLREVAPEDTEPLGIIGRDEDLPRCFLASVPTAVGIYRLP